MFVSKPLKGRAVPLATYARAYKNGEMVDTGNGLFKKRPAHESCHNKTGVVYSVTQHALVAVKQAT